MLKHVNMTEKEQSNMFKQYFSGRICRIVSSFSILFFFLAAFSFSPWLDGRRRNLWVSFLPGSVRKYSESRP